MVDAPENIGLVRGMLGLRLWNKHDDNDQSNAIAYTRSDIVAELAAENERLKQRLADHPRATNTVESHETANVIDKPEGQQEPVAYRYKYADPISGKAVWRHAGGLWNGQSPEESQPLYTRPSEQAVTEASRAMLEAIDAELDTDSRSAAFLGRVSRLRAALKAAMEAGG